MKKMKWILGIFVTLAVVFFTACQEMGIDPEGDGQTRLVIKVTDAPFPIDTIEAALVNITKVEIRKVGDGEEDGYPFIPLDVEKENFNLLDLRNGVTADLVDAEIEPGMYDLIRVYVDEVGLKIKQGEMYDLKVPSGQQTGIKIHIEPALNVVSGLTAELLLDFNVEESFILKGNIHSPAGIKGFNFKPVIRAVNNTTSGILQGVVDYSDTLQENVSVRLFQDTLITSAFTDTAGFYAMPGLPAGLYTVSAAKEGFDTVTVEGVEIVEGNLTVQNLTLTKTDTTATE